MNRQTGHTNRLTDPLPIDVAAVPADDEIDAMCRCAAPLKTERVLPHYRTGRSCPCLLV